MFCANISMASISRKVLTSSAARGHFLLKAPRDSRTLTYQQINMWPHTAHLKWKHVGAFQTCLVFTCPLSMSFYPFCMSIEFPDASWWGLMVEWDHMHHVTICIKESFFSAISAFPSAFPGPGGLLSGLSRRANPSSDDIGYWKECCVEYFMVWCLFLFCG